MAKTLEESHDHLETKKGPSRPVGFSRRPVAERILGIFQAILIFIIKREIKSRSSGVGFILS